MSKVSSMKRVASVTALLVLILIWTGCDTTDENPLPADIVVVALEATGELAFLDASNGRLFRTVSLEMDMGDVPSPVNVHNVQGSPDGSWVWATVLPDMSGGGGAPMPEELVGYELSTGTIRRISLGEDLHVAHVVIHGTIAYVTANEADRVLVVDLIAGLVEEEIELPSGCGPHGLRLTPNGGKLVIAGYGNGSMQVVDVVSRVVTSYDLPGLAVQTAVLPNGSAAYATLYDTRQVARLDFMSDQITLFELPGTSVGPIQLYPSAATGLLWVADQGALAGQPVGHQLFALNTGSGIVERAVNVGQGPHGVVVEPESERIWVTNLVGGSVQCINGTTGQVIATTIVGGEPNGITFLHHEYGSMP